MNQQRAFSKIAQSILHFLKSHPNGLDIEALRKKVLPKGKMQQHFDRRLRELDPFYIINRSRDGRQTIYKLAGERPKGQWEYGVIDKTLRAKVLTKASSRCQMCGRTIIKDQIELHIDHKIPLTWGGQTVPENLWAICSACNLGKKNYFATFDDTTMKEVMGEKSVHKRIAQLLKLKNNYWVESDMIEFVANYNDYQTDWRKRLRELRYLGLQIESTRKKVGRRTISLYKLLNWVDLPPDASSAARDYEAKRAAKNQAIKNS